jgi:hypothetical protein
MATQLDAYEEELATVKALLADFADPKTELNPAP